MVKGKILKIVKAPADWEIIQETGGRADISVEVIIEDNPADDTDIELDFTFEEVYARIVNEESGEFATPLTKFEKTGEIYGCKLCGVPCGGPYLLDFVLFNRAKNIESPLVAERRRHFCVGDVYIIAGQSNAAGMGKGFLTEKSEMGLHILRNLDFWDIASHPFNDFDYSKQSMFLAFAKHIKKRTGRPIGLIPASMGGSPLSRWIKDEGGDLYAKMLKSLKNNCISAKAVLWYQGCSDAWTSDSETEYLERFKKFVDFLREDLNNSDLPIFTFQLNRQKLKEKEDDKGYDFVREAQRRAANEISNVYVLPTIDCLNMSDFIHNAKSSNLMLGERLAIQVLQKLYGIGIGADAPEISKAYFVSEKEIRLKFSNVTEFLYAFNSSIADFPITVEDGQGKIDIEDYIVSEDSITLILKRDATGGVFVSGQTGSDPQNIIIDYGTQIPMLCFYKFKVER